MSRCNFALFSCSSILENSLVIMDEIQESSAAVSLNAIAYCCLNLIYTDQYILRFSCRLCAFTNTSPKFYRQCTNCNNL